MTSPERAAERRLSAASVRRTMRLSVADAMVYALMVGVGEAYFLADGIRLGATPLQLGLLVGLPLCLGAAGPLVALRALARLRSRKPALLVAAASQAGVLALLGAGDATRVSTPWTLIAFASLYQVCGQGAGTVWSSWFGDLVPRAVRGRYFGNRNRAAHLATCVGLVAGGLFLQHVEPGTAAEATAASGGGFAWLFGVASALRAVSVGLLAVSSEPAFHGTPDRVRVLRFLSSERGSRAWRLVLSVAALQYVVYVAAPYFQPFMLENLGFTYAEYMLASVAAIAAKVVFVPAWGTLVDQVGARPICTLTAVLVAIIPLPFLWAGGLGWVLLAQAFSGFSWAGFEVSEFTLVLELSYRRTRLHVFAALSTMNGVAQLLGSLTGALLVGVVTDLRYVFAVSLVARLLVGAAFARFLPTPRDATPVRRRELLLRVIGIRPAGGLVHRPLLAPQLEDADAPEGTAEAEETVGSRRA